MTPGQEKHIRKMLEQKYFLTFEEGQDLLEEVDRLRSQIKVTERSLVYVTDLLINAERVINEARISSKRAKKLLEEIQGGEK